MPRIMAYGPIGVRANGLIDWGARGRTNAIGACVNGKLVAAAEYDTTITTDVFYSWVETVFIPSLTRKTALIIDNASFHKHPKIKELLEHHGHTLAYLPRYSPHLNPIEHLWAQLKAFIRRFQCSLFEALTSCQYLWN
jgi:transposase